MQSLANYIKIKISQPNSIFFGSKSFFLAYQFELLQVFRFDSQFILRQNWFELMFLYNSLVAIVNKVGKLQAGVIISQCY